MPAMTVKTAGRVGPHRKTGTGRDREEEENGEAMQEDRVARGLSEAPPSSVNKQPTSSLTSDFLNKNLNPGRPKGFDTGYIIDPRHNKWMPRWDLIMMCLLVR